MIEVHGEMRYALKWVSLVIARLMIKSGVIILLYNLLKMHNRLKSNLIMNLYYSIIFSFLPSA